MLVSKGLKKFKKSNFFLASESLMIYNYSGSASFENFSINGGVVV